MKKNHIILFTIFCSLSLGSISEATDLKEGFMGYRWGENISIHNDLTWLYAKKDVSFYSNHSVSYTIDETTVDDVIFGFYKDSFFAVYIAINNPETYDKIQQYLKSNYGFPATQTSTKDNFATRKWKYQGISIKLKTDEISGKMKLAFYNRSITGSLQKDQLDKIGETSYRFFPIDKNKKPRMIPFLEF